MWMEGEGSFWTPSSWDHLVKASERVLLKQQPSCVPPHSQRQPSPNSHPPSIQFREIFPPHKSPISPLPLVPALGGAKIFHCHVYPAVAFRRGILSSPNRWKRKIVRLAWRTDAASWSLHGSWSELGLKLALHSGLIKQMLEPSGRELTSGLMVFSPLFSVSSLRF